MARVILLDSAPLGLLSDPKPMPQPQAARAWLAALLAAGHRVLVPEIADYEVRRELIRSRKLKGLRALDRLGVSLEYLPLTTTALRRAAELWAVARQTGRPTAPDPALDGDVILAAQALTLADPAAVVATGNPGHLSRFAPAEGWRAVGP